MKKLILPFLSLALLFNISCDDDNGKVRIVGSGNVITESRTLDPFDEIEIRSVIDANIIFGISPELTVTADDNIIDLVSTEVNQNKLIVTLPDGEYEDITVIINSTNPDIQSISATGVNNISVSGFQNLDQLDVNITGVGNLEMVGSAELLNVNNSGSTNVFGFDFIAKTCNINLSGVGNIQITVTDLLTGSLTGVGNIFYKGNPQVSVSVSGVGNLINSN